MPAKLDLAQKVQIFRFCAKSKSFKYNNYAEPALIIIKKKSWNPTAMDALKKEMQECDIKPRINNFLGFWDKVIFSPNFTPRKNPFPPESKKFRILKT